jgi:16S rRNA G966 N2-methylase RsmD
MTTAHYAARGGRDAKQQAADERRNMALYASGALTDYTDAHERAVSESETCPYCSKDVHPSNWNAHMALYHAEDALTDDERHELEKHEAVIESGLQTFYSVGMALLAIRDKSLYRQQFKTFEAYCAERWNMGRRNAYQLMSAVEVVENVRHGAQILPANERQVRPLTRLEPEEQQLVWKVVEETAPAGKITEAHVKSVVTVLKEITATGAIDSGDGVQIPVKQATVEHLKAAVTEETYERVKRQETYVAEKLEKKKAQRESLKVRKVERETPPDDMPEKDERYTLITGDIDDVLPTLEDGSIDAIITDPPYPEEYLYLYRSLAIHAARLLKPGGSLIVMCGQSYIPEILERMTPYVRYHWMSAYLTPGGQSVQLWQRKVNTFWKPLLWFVNGNYTDDWIGDVMKSAVNDNDKRFHNWGQSESGMAEIITKHTRAGQTILDPFVGGGTTALVALALNRKIIGVDISPESIETSHQRISQWLQTAK